MTTAPPSSGSSPRGEIFHVTFFFFFFSLSPDTAWRPTRTRTSRRISSSGRNDFGCYCYLSPVDRNAGGGSVGRGGLKTRVALVFLTHPLRRSRSPFRLGRVSYTALARHTWRSRPPTGIAFVTARALPRDRRTTEVWRIFSTVLPSSRPLLLDNAAASPLLSRRRPFVLHFSLLFLSPSTVLFRLTHSEHNRTRTHSYRYNIIYL